MYKIEVDDNCIGCEGCTCCDNFVVEDGRSRPIKPEVEELGCAQEAADICPAKAISITKL